MIIHPHKPQKQEQENPHFQTKLKGRPNLIRSTKKNNVNKKNYEKKVERRAI